MAPARSLLPRWIGARPRAARKRRAPLAIGLTAALHEPPLPELPELPELPGLVGPPGLAGLPAERAELGAPDEPPMPAIITRAQDEARCRLVLARLGYRKVRAEYVRHRQHRRDTFGAIAHAELWPTMDFVRAWLKDERRRILLHVRSTFLAVMLTTIVTGVAFVIALVLLNWRA
jgi:hypothetical protein